jgi:ribosomal protein L22
MFIFPAGTTPSDFFRKNIEIQLSLLSSMSASFLNTSLRLSELNLEAGRRLVEESAAALQKGMQLTSLADTQSFILEQSQATVQKVRGYQQNVQNIMAENLRPLDARPDARVTAQTMEPGSAHDQEPAKEAASHAQHHAGHGQHETDHRASGLVEKLIASAVSDADNNRKQP